ncbi:MAG: FAD-dependent monooxygenase [Verrucomicrobiales bacterium]|nr:FAD-dependent monooxygenase [Verrucomicrobiales bacterium]
MNADAKRDLLVVGAGPVGLITAVLGARAGLDVEIVDQEWRIASRSYACVLHPHSLGLLDRLGLLSRALELGTRVDAVGFYEGPERKAEVHLGALAEAEHRYALVLYQDDLEGLIEDTLRDRYGRRVGWGRRLDGLIWNDDSVTAILESLHHEATGEAATRWTEVVERRLLTTASYIAGADGPRSRLVHLLGTESESAGEPMHYGIFEFEPSEGVCVSDELRVAIDGPTTHVLWPLPGGTCRWSVQSDGTGGLAGDDIPVPGRPPSLPQAIRKAAPWFGNGVRNVDWATRVEFPKRILHHFGRGRCWALGDAAHQTAPGGAQGMNLGFREAEEFVEMLRRVIREGAELEVLHAASRRWRAEWRCLLGLEPSIVPEAGADPWVASHATQLASCLPASGPEYAALLGQLGLRWKGGPQG